MAHDRDVAGIRCTSVLAHLSEYIDGELDNETRSRIDAHLAGCDWCEQFGGVFSSIIRDLRRSLADPPGPPQDVQDRLFDRLGLGPDPGPGPGDRTP